MSDNIPTSIVLSVCADHFKRLRRAADKRELPPAVLLERIAATVLGEPDLINAVLDDE